MEPANLNSEPADAPLENMLRARFTAAPLPDNGFSQQVLASLPPPTPVQRPSIRPWLVAAGAVVGCSVAWPAFDSGPQISRQLETLGPDLGAALAPLVDPSLGIAVLATALSLALIYHRSLTAKLQRWT